MPTTFRFLGAAALFMVLTLAGCSDDSDADPLVVSTDKGSLKGIEKTATRQFLGIPYAAKPMRWQAPAEAGPWAGLRDASSFGANCAQPDTPFGFVSDSEDCLFLNVYRPTGDGPFPVMVWIHGGALQYGEGSAYDPSQMVAEGVVVVTLNYRLGALGFLAHASLSAEGGGSSGNYGLMDQQAALRWVQRNIAAFGGNAGNVTIAGESAGGHSVHAHLASPLSAGLFHKAIVQSGSYSVNTPTLQAQQALGQAFATAAGCSDQTAACLRNLSVSSILANQAALNAGLAISTNIDNRVLLRSHRDAFSTGNFNRVPVMEGTNANEFSVLTAFLFDYGPPPPNGLGEVTAGNYAFAQGGVLGLSETVQWLPKSVAQVDAKYPLSTFARPAQAIDKIAGDSIFSCSALSTVRALAAFTAVYQYEFNDPNAPGILLPPTPSHPVYGAAHASELPYLFRMTQPHPPLPVPLVLSAAQQALSAKMITLWASFARAGVPSAAGSTAWPAFSGTSQTLLSLEPGGLRTSSSFSVDHGCDFWLTP